MLVRIRSTGLDRRHDIEFVRGLQSTVKVVMRDPFIAVEDQHRAIEFIAIEPDHSREFGVACGHCAQTLPNGPAFDLDHGETADPLGKRGGKPNTDTQSVASSASKRSHTRSLNCLKKSRVMNASVLSAGFGRSNT